MKIYTLSHQSFLKFRSHLIQRMGVMFLIVLALIIGVALYQGSINGVIFLIALPPLIGIYGFSIYRAIKQQQQIWESIEIELGDDYVARRQLRIPEVRLYRQEIQSLQETNQGLYLFTADKFRSLAIPAALDPPDYREIKTHLSAWRPIEPKAPATKTKTVIQSGLLLIGFGVIFFSTSLWLVLIVGLAVIGYYGYLFWLLQRQPGIDPKFRRSFLGGGLFLIFIVSFKLCLLYGTMRLLLEPLTGGK